MSTALRCGPVKVSALVTALALLAMPSGANAQCKDTFNVITAGGSPIQTAMPAGVGTTINALVSTINSVNTAFLTNTASFVSSPGGATAGQQGGGVWGRTVGGYAETKATTTLSLSIGGVPDPGSGICHGIVREEYVGTQFGLDLAAYNLGSTGGNFHLGLTGGYFLSQAKDITGGNPNLSGYVTNLTFPPGSLSADFKVPFAGAYAVYTNGGFFLDTQARFDLYKISLNDRSNGLVSAPLDARGVSVTGNVGYNVKLDSGWFIEPSIGGVWSRVSVDNFDTPGVLVQVGGGPVYGAGTTYNLFGKGILRFDDVESLLGRASLRVGTTITNGNYIWQPFATASVLHEFSDNVVAKSETVSGGTTNIITTSTDRVGTYGQFGLGTGLVFGNSGWLGYGRVDYKTGQNVEGVNVNIGLRHQW
jgi:hypothetical protein